MVTQPQLGHREDKEREEEQRSFQTEKANEYTSCKLVSYRDVYENLQAIFIKSFTA